MPNLEFDVFGMLAYADRERSLEATFPEHLEQRPDRHVVKAQATVSF